ncbi:SMP-30/gluconolactonase/LRE family protein [Ramlibacter sp.]|uniref:SMP-30/gluconolactonase/LRE family protein n=1 Tax=Ramlibacter sp. TaxID=1917967 RepID=UPI0017A9AB22|nr:SMP-30/gluconolactonase/LRE family protein [Ramlibacter sp.]MBA2672153.1 SMP-30/gluconolactonase/LRE family protein [Ramlibacter sp.]
MNWQAVVEEPDTLGESPFWHAAEQRLYWVDIDGRRIRRCNADGGAPEEWPMPTEPGCIAPAAAGGLVIALRDGVYRARSWGAALQCIARFNHDPAITRFNDGKADPLGRMWAGTMYEPRDASKGELYSIDCRPDNGQQGVPGVQLKAQNNIIANGLAWSPDTRVLYWANTTRHVVHAWDWDAATNALRHQRVFHEFAGKPSGWQPGDPGYGGRPDGAAVDVEGNYWVAMFEGQRLVKLSPAGAVLQEFPLPVRCPTMPCFGGENLRTLYVTSATHKRSAEELSQLPLSGRLIAMQVDSPGLPVNFFID